MEDFLIRSLLLIGEDGIEKLAKAHVAVAGIGGVGSYLAEALARSGIGKLTLVDHDVIDKSNINRQIHALHSTVGQKKVQVMSRRLKDINPKLEIIGKEEFITADNVAEIFADEYDYLIDAVDNVTAKIALVLLTQRRQIPFISSMGTANKLDNTKFCFCDISQTSVCPLARVMRRELRKRGIEKGVEVLYSQGESIKIAQKGEEKISSPGSMSFVPSTAGLLLAGRVINELLKAKING